MDQSPDPAPEGPSPRGPHPVRFTEPTEGAYTLIVPADWPVQGGVARNGSEARTWARVVSPGGGAELRISDPRVPMSYLAPGFGMMMPLPGVAVRPYVPPPAFAEEYARFFAGETGAAAFEVTAFRDIETILRDDPRPETRPRVQEMMQQGMEMAGLTFACPDRGLCGLVDVLTLRMPGPVGLVWMPFLTALIGPADAWPDVKAMLLQIAHSHTLNPAWQQQQLHRQQMQHQMTMETMRTNQAISNMRHQSNMQALQSAAERAQISAQTYSDIGAMQMQSWHQQQASSDEMHRRSVNAINETVDLYDATSGQVYHGAPAGFRTYWTDGLDRVVGHDGHDNPDPTRFRKTTDLDDLHRSDPSRRT